jgi:HEPN domain-containing protein
MARWRKGEQQVTSLIEQRHLQQVAADSQTAAALLASASRHVESAGRTVDADPEAAYALAYDAARKSATALLAHQGLRPTTSGGHIAVVDSIRAQFPGVPGLTSLDRLRRRRNQAEYPNPTSYDPITVDEANDAIQTAGECVSSASRLPQLDELGIF